MKTSVAIAILLCGVSLAAEELIANFDFTKPGKEWHVKGKGSFDGFLPEGLEPDFPAWNKSQVKAELLDDGSQPFARFTVNAFDNVQFRATTDKFDNETYCKVEVVCRANEAPIVQFRQKSAPYRFHSVMKTNGCAEKLFVKTTLLADLRNNSFKNIGFFLCLANCETDLRSVRISRLSKEEIKQLIQRPVEGTANFFRNSRFPLGIQSGWNISQALTQGQGDVSADSGAPGPSGSPALKIEFAKEATLFAEPFQTNRPELQNHVEFSCQAKGQWTAILSDNFGRNRMDLHVLGRKKINESGEWVKTRLDFTPNPQAKSFTLAFKGQGALRVDSLRAWAGDDNLGYVSQGECEVALAFPKTATSIARLQFADEPAKLDYCVTGNAKDAILKFKAVNLYGQETALPEIVNPEAGSIDFSLALQGRPYGQFRIEAWVERDGKRIAPLNEMIVTRIRKPVHWNEDAPESPFGCHFNPSPVLLPMMKAAGVNWVRLHDLDVPGTNWCSLEREKEKWSFDDNSIKLYRNAKIKISGMLQTAPPWASSYKDSGKKGFNEYFDRFWTVSDFDGWSNYVETVCARYKGEIDCYYAWNEPWGSNFLHDSYDEETRKYLMKGDIGKNQAAICRLAWTAAKSINPSAKLSGYNFTGNEEQTRKAIEAGAFDYCDIVDFHVYCGAMREAIYRKTVEPLLKADIKKPVHVSEGSGGLNLYGSFDGLYKASIPWRNECNQANFLLPNQHCQYVERLLSYGVERVNLYSANGYNYLGVKSDYLTLVGEDGYPHSMLAAFSNMTWLLEGRKCVKLVHAGKDFEVAFFEGRGGAVAVFSGAPDNGSFTIPESSDWTCSDLFGNPCDGVCRGTLVYVSSQLTPEKLAGELLDDNSAQSRKPAPWLLRLFPDWTN